MYLSAHTFSFVVNAFFLLTQLVSYADYASEQCYLFLLFARHRLSINPLHRPSARASAMSASK